jgi:penicillin-binding protein 2
VREPRIAERKSVSVASVVGSPEETPSRPNVRLYVVGGVVLLLFAVLILRLWTLQIIDGKTYAASVTHNEIRVVSVPAPRGEIVDRADTVLAGNETVEELVLSRATAAQDPSIIGDVAALVGETPAQVRQAVNDSQYSPYEPVPILDNAPPTVIQYYEEHQSSFPGVSLQQVSQRAYPQNRPGNPIASAVLGYVSSITTKELNANPGAGYTQGSQFGQSGLENEYESYLRGTAGRQALSVNASGQVVGTLSKTDPAQGDTVVTNLDLGLQEAAEAALQSDIVADRHTVDTTTHKLPTANDGAVVVLDAQTGAVLAMASYPTYDLGEWIGGISHANYAALSAGCNTTSTTTGCPLINYAIDGLYTPGSTFKLNTATAALNDGIITPNTSVDDTGTYTVKNCTEGCVFHDDEASDAGETDLQEALTKSDDYYFYKLGDLFYSSSNPTGIQQTASDYGLGQKTGIDLPGEDAGQVDSAALRAEQHKEDPGDFPNPGYLVGDNIEMAFGQGETLVTPIQNALAYATFANGGTRYQPQVASAIVSPEGHVVKQFSPQVTGKVSLSPTNYQAMLAGFEGVVNSPSGTANATFQQYAHFPMNDYLIAGKTGTADVSPGLEPNAWFVGFGPVNHAANQPEYVVAAVVDHGGYGAQAAAPAVANIFNYLYANPVSAVTLPSAAHPGATTPPATVPPAGSATTTTTTTTSGTTTTTGQLPGA